jgi:thiamine biosynthesis lipoprotein
VTAPAGQAAAVGLGEARGLRRFSHEAMATVFELLADHDDDVYAGQAAHAAFELVDRLEQELSRFRPNSDVSRVSALRAGQATRVGPDTMECLLIARHLFELTGGAFDVSIGTGLLGLDLDAEGLAVHARADGVKIDLGGIGKGFAVDRMAALVEDWGLERALVHGGRSSVLALEPPRGREAWDLDLAAPGLAPARSLPRVAARQTALSASGTGKGGHILDPRSGGPAPDAAVFVLLPRSRGADHAPAAVADALSTACMLLTVARIEAIVRQNPGLEVYRLSSPGTGENTRVVHLGPAARPGPPHPADGLNQVALAPGEPREE